MENKLKHLEMIQNIINRMASNSFLVKGWCVTLVAAVFVLSAKDANTMFVAVAFFLCLCFGCLMHIFYGMSVFSENYMTKSGLPTKV